jgi:hypothetical protein
VLFPDIGSLPIQPSRLSIYYLLSKVETNMDQEHYRHTTRRHLQDSDPQHNHTQLTRAYTVPWLVVQCCFLHASSHKGHRWIDSRCISPARGKYGQTARSFCSSMRSGMKVAFLSEHSVSASECHRTTLWAGSVGSMIRC